MDVRLHLGRVAVGDGERQVQGGLQVPAFRGEVYRVQDRGLLRLRAGLVPAGGGVAGRQRAQRAAARGDGVGEGKLPGVRLLRGQQQGSLADARVRQISIDVTKSDTA